MFARFCDQDHAFPSVVLQGECNVYINLDDDSGVEIEIMLAPRGLTGPWCGIGLVLSAVEASAIAANLKLAADHVLAVKNGA